MKKLLLLFACLAPFISEAAKINWNILQDPAGKTVCGSQIGSVVHIAILDVTSGFPSDGKSFWERSIADGKAGYSGTQPGIQVGKDFVTGKTIDTIPLSVEKIMIAVIDEDWNYLGSNMISCPDGGWDATDITWTPTWYLQTGGTKHPIDAPWGGDMPQTADGWAVFGRTTPVPVPEPSVVAGILLGTVLILSRRKKRA